MLGDVGRIEPATSVFGDFELTMDELRAVARYVAESAQAVLPVFEESVPDDRRPRAALDAAREFVDGARRTRLQRVTALDAHRAAKDAPTEEASLAARCAGDAAAAAYLHPIVKATQVGHILRAAASAARIAELRLTATREQRRTRSTTPGDARLPWWSTSSPVIRSPPPRELGSES